MVVAALDQLCRACIVIPLMLGLRASLCHAQLLQGIDAFLYLRYEAASAELRPLAEAGDRDAQFYLGEIAERTSVSGTEDKKKQALSEELEWYGRAAEKGHAEAQEKLGVMYFLGLDVPRDDVQALKWLSLAAAQNRPEAAYFAGQIYEEGRGVAADQGEALRWYRKSAAAGSASGQFRLGWLLANGNPISRAGSETATELQANRTNPVASLEDRTQFWRLLEDPAFSRLTPDDRRKRIKALNVIQKLPADQRDPVVEEVIKGRARLIEKAELAAGPTDYDAALYWYRRAAAQGHSDAQVEVDLMEVLRLKAPTDYRSYAKLALISAKRGDPKSQLALGLMVLNRSALLSGADEKVDWMAKAAAAGVVMAQRYLGDRYYPSEEGLAWYRKAAQAGDAEAQRKLADSPSLDDSEKVRWYTRSARQGSLQAQKDLAFRLGLNPKADPAKAAFWYRKAAEQGDASSMENYALACREGRGVPKNQKEAARWFEKAADQNQVMSQLNLGRMYALGDGVAQDYGTAIQWLRQVAESPDGYPGYIADAQEILGLMYMEGDGVTIDLAEGMWLLLLAASKGQADAEYQVALVYEDGKGQEVNEEESLKWLRRAALHGHFDAQWHLGELYDSGKKVPRDAVESAKWFRLAAEGLRESAESGDPAAQWQMGSALQKAKDYAEALGWYLKASQAGFLAANNKLGVLYLSGHGVLQDNAEAVKWFRKGAEGGDPYAQENLGQLLAFSKGVAQDFVEAHKWLNLASVSSPSAGIARDELAERMTPSQVALAQELAKAWRASGGHSNTYDPNVGKRSSVARAAGTTGPKALALARSGTGFFVSPGGRLLTNYHVVNACTETRAQVGGKEVTLSLQGQDASNDLAVLSLPDVGVSAFALFADSRRARLGGSVMALGYPLRGLLASGVQVTMGNISALAGIGDDTRMLQFTAPVQPGNSGGPLLDETGSVIGVVDAKLNALKVAKVTGDVPQNINFAIKSDVIRTFMETNGVQYRTSSVRAKLDPADIAEQAKRFTVPVECWQ